MKATIQDYPNLYAMPVPKRIEELEKTCIDALSGGLHPERMKDLIQDNIENEQFELVRAIMGATEKFQRSPQLSLFLFNVPEQYKEPRPEIDPLAFLTDDYD